MRLALLSIAISCTVTACAERPPEPFALRVEASTDEGAPVAAAGVTVDGKLIGRTDGEGRLSLQLPASSEGQRLTVEVQPPEGLKAVRARRELRVERILTRAQGTTERRTAPLEVRALFAPTQRRYALVIDVGVPDLPIELFGVEKARTNAEGVALLLAPGVPGDTLEVRVDAGARPTLRPRAIRQTFTLPDHAEAFVLAGAFTELQPPKPRPHRPHRL